jgi:hypothetical protein
LTRADITICNSCMYAQPKAGKLCDEANKSVHV